MPAERRLRLFNTLSRQTEPVVPIEPGHIRLYSCGPTVYSYAHIGNFRSFLTADLIARTATALGIETTYVTNVTDVGHLTKDDVADSSGEDRMAKALQSKEGEKFANVWDLARYYTGILIDDWTALNLRDPSIRPRATEHIREQIGAVMALVERGFAYETDQGVYFSVAKYPDYGKLSGNRSADDLEEAVRETVSDPGKKDPRDFALWKKDDKHLMQWYSPWGWGFPGWHIECSVMASTYLGEEIDIHAGGEDLIFPHHECEIAQAESISGKTFARHWVHTRFLQVEGEKMAKSKGNFYTVRDLIAPAPHGRGIDPLAVRLALISGHYRKPLNFTFDNLRASARHVLRFRETDSLVGEAIATDRNGDDRLADPLDGLYASALAALSDDLNTPEAIAAVLEGVKLINAEGKGLNTASARSAGAWLDRVNALLGIVRTEAPVDERDAASKTDGAEDEFAERVEALITERVNARSSRQFDRADAIRDELTSMGVELMDSPEGTKWRRTLSL